MTLEQSHDLEKYQDAIGETCIVSGQWTGWGGESSSEREIELYHIDTQSDYLFEDAYGNQFKRCKVLDANNPRDGGMKFKSFQFVIHVKTGGRYMIVGTPNKLRIESTNEPAYAYQRGSEEIWIRPQSEMEDGRFVLAEGEQ